MLLPSGSETTLANAAIPAANSASSAAPECRPANASRSGRRATHSVTASAETRVQSSSGSTARYE